MLENIKHKNLKVYLIFGGISLVVSIIVWVVLTRHKPRIIQRTNAANTFDFSQIKPYGTTTVPKIDGGTS